MRFVIIFALAALSCAAQYYPPNSGSSGSGTVTNVSATAPLLTFTNNTTTPVLAWTGLTAGGFPCATGATTMSQTANATTGNVYTAVLNGCPVAGADISVAGGVVTIADQVVNAVGTSSLPAYSFTGFTSQGLYHNPVAGAFTYGATTMMAGNSYPVTSWSYTYGTVIPGDSIYGFTNTAGNSLLAPDTGLCRLSSGKLEVTTSASCNALGGISAATAAFSSSLSVGGGAIGSNTFYCYNSTATTGSTLCTVQDGAGQSGAALQVKQNGGTVGLSLASSGTITSANGVIVTGGKTCTLNTTTGVFACV